MLADPPRASRHFLKRTFFIALTLTALAVGVAASWIAGGKLTTPVQSNVGTPPPALKAEEVDWVSRQGRRVHGWFVPGRPGRGAILLLHALRADRRSMVGRARFLSRAGYTVLLIDMQAHGANPGSHITFGLREARDAGAAVEYLTKKLPGERIGVIGSSLGGAASLLGDTPLPVHALVLEAVYPTIGEAVENRLALRFGDAGRYLAPLLLWQLGPRLGIDPERLSPTNRIGRIAHPVLVIAGEKDRHTTLSQSRALYDRAPDPKALWVIENASHVHFHRHAGAAYEKRVLDFFERYLR